MAHGLTLTVASTIIWYAPIYSNEQYEQANARIARPGQKKVTNIVQIAATSVERRIYGVLRDKGRLQSVVLDLAKEGK
jgi:SNF2 family DNA or RNA helicase